MPASEFRRWCSFYADEPFDDRTTNVLLAHIATTLRNANRGSNTQAVDIFHYAPWLRPKVEDDGSEGVDMTDLMGDGW